MPLVAVALVALIGIAALAIDVGYWRYEQRVEQAAADSGALAGANELAFIGAGDVSSAAKADVASNGFPEDANTVVTVHQPPASGPYAGNPTAVEVVVEKKAAPFFSSYFGITQWIRVRAVAIASSNAANCIIALTGDITLNGGGGGGINAPTCGMITNANLTVTGAANVDALAIGYVGTGPAGGTYPLGQPQPSLAVSDPCPTVPGCAYLTNLTLHNPSALHTGCMPQASPLPNPLPPGEYCQTLSLSGTQAFASGLFVLDDGFTANGTATLTGSGVTLYNGGGVALSGVTLSGNVNINVSAPTTGPTAGMVYYQPASNNNTFTSNGRAGTDNFAGGFYLPTANFHMNGNIPNVSFIVAASITMNGGGMSAGSNAGYAMPVHGVLAE